MFIDFSIIDIDFVTFVVGLLYFAKQNKTKQNGKKQNKN